MYVVQTVSQDLLSSCIMYCCNLHYHREQGTGSPLSLERSSLEVGVGVGVVSAIDCGCAWFALGRDNPKTSRCSQRDDKDQKDDQNEDQHSNAAARPGICVVAVSVVLFTQSKTAHLPSFCLITKLIFFMPVCNFP